MKYIYHTEGYLQPDGAGGFEYVYQYKDHLGNVRLSYSDVNGDGVVNVNEIIEENNYYPFGLKHKGYNTMVSGQQNKFLTYNAVELEEVLGLTMYEMDFRQYDPAIARWLIQDPVVHHSMSPYNAFDNNPVFWADPSGADSQAAINFERSLGADGLTNEQWLRPSAPGGGGFDAMRAQNRANYAYIAALNQQASVDVGTGSFGVVQQDPCPKCPDKDKRRLAIMMADHAGGNAQDYYNAMVNEDFVAERSAENIEVIVSIMMAGETPGLVSFFKRLFTKKVFAKLIIRPDIVLNGGRSGQLVKNLTGPPNSILKGSKGRIFITDKSGKVILDITNERAKAVTPGKGFGTKVKPTKEQLKLIEKVWN